MRERDEGGYDVNSHEKKGKGGKMKLGGIELIRIPQPLGELDLHPHHPSPFSQPTFPFYEDI